MNVRDLIAHLRKFPPDARVVRVGCGSWDGLWAEVSEVAVGNAHAIVTNMQVLKGAYDFNPEQEPFNAVCID